MSSSTVRQRSVGDELREKRKEQRQLKKIKNDTETKRRRRVIIWSIALVLLLSLSVYYYNYKPSKTRQRASTDSSPSSAPSSTPNENPKANDHSSRKTPPKTPPSSKSKKNKDSSKKVPPKKDERPPPPKQPPPPKSRDEVLNTKINDLPILRRPIPPSDPDRPLIMEILEADDFLRVGDYAQALEKFKKILKRFKQSPRGLLGRGLALEGLGKTKESVKYLDKAIDTYYNLAFESGPLANEDIRLAALLGLAECSERRHKTKILIKALKKAVEMEPKHELYTTKLAQAYMKGTQMERAQKLLEEVVDKWPGNSLAHANLGYLLYRGGSYEEALPHLVKGLVENKEVQRNGKFYLYTGETLTKLNKSEEADLVYAEGVARGLFPSVDQRSLYNEANLEAKPWWNVNEVGEQVLVELEKKTTELKSELMSAIETNADIFSDANQTRIVLASKGKRNKKPCTVLPVLCHLLDRMPSATQCRRGETKILLLPGPVHIPPHVGLTNTNLRALLPLALSGPLKIRMNKDTRMLQEGVVSVIDDSFEQELLYVGKGQGLVLSIDFWHPDLPQSKRPQLSPL